jgi:hypothetical protein
MNFKDKHGRDRPEKITTGALKIVLRALPEQQSTPIAHGLDLEFEVSKLKDVKGLITITDQGKDNQRERADTQLALWRLKKNCGLGIVVQTSHAPGSSWLNIAERKMSLLNNISGSYIPDTLPGESTRPRDQRDLTKKQRAMKQRQIKLMVLDFLVEHWSPLIIGEHKTEVRVATLSVRSFLHLLPDIFNDKFVIITII